MIRVRVRAIVRASVRVRGRFRVILRVTCCECDEPTAKLMQSRCILKMNKIAKG